MAELNRVVLQQLLHKEAEGTLTPHEQQMLDEWHHTFDVPEKEHEVFRDENHEQLIKVRLFNRILNSGYAENKNISPQKTVRFSPSFRWTAAAAVFLLALGYGVFQLKKNDTRENSYAEIKKPTAIPLRKGVKRIVLADGSTVILNKGSHLDYSETFDKNTREVYLHGEAYFDISHDEKKPFLVHTGKLTTRVLGTAFNIKTTKENDVEVTVSRGKVAVSDQKKTLAVLLPDQKISYHVSSNIAEKTTSNAKIATLWKEEDLVLNDISMDQAVSLLEERYGTEINLSTTEISHCKFTAYFLNTTSLTQVLKVISKLNNLSYTQTKNGAYILSGDGCEIKNKTHMQQD